MQNIIRKLHSIFGTNNVLSDVAQRWTYGYDNSRRQALPDAVVFATNCEQLIALMQLCNELMIPIIPRGRGTGTTGATVPDQGGIVVSFEKMQQILEINPDDRLVVVEPGVVNKELQQKLAEYKFFWPPDPSSAAVCTIGGNLAYNAAGPKAVKYGTPRDNTLGLTAITGTGQEIRCGVRTSKGVVGYDLTRLLIGSEGTLGLITQATLRLTPLPEATCTLRALYQDINSAAAAVAAIMAQPITPCALEFMDGVAVQLANEQGNLGLSPQIGAMLIIEVDGAKDCVTASANQIATTAAVSGMLECTIATNISEVKQLWQARKALSPALRKIAPKKVNEDVVVPVSKMPIFIKKLSELEQIYGIKIVNFGHAGNGNIHVNLLINPDNSVEMAQANQCLTAMFDIVLNLGGTLSGEHGVGLEKRDFVNKELSPAALNLMWAIKRQFDPNNILNPGKSLPNNN
jgi:D-lactate dehydrogenase